MLSIRRFFVDRKSENFINTSMLLRHSACFIIYIVSSMTFFLMFGIYAHDPTTENYRRAAAAGIFF